MELLVRHPAVSSERRQAFTREGCTTSLTPMRSAFDRASIPRLI
jgi:hypothetical protein